MNDLRLFSIPHAGGSSISYYPWRKYLDNNIEFIPLELKGRGRRITEELSQSLEDMVTDLYIRIRPFIYTGKYAIFGHSMGSILTYELVRRIQIQNDLMPVHLFFSGSKPPEYISRIASVYKETDEKICDEIIKLGGTPKILFESDELLNLYLNIIKTDFKNLYEYSYHNNKLDCNASFFYGMEDDEIEPSKMIQWNNYISGNTDILSFPGNHFYLFDNCQRVVQQVNDMLEKYI
ncbi:thioesterase [Anaerocolumna cellulosilytica]|uniref:Thioesterase n=1 Tax=Anaerocolumna cellulosilytica TaxID=433286 RepID=A0A6S6R8C4_9FIRM|nr:thioesterase [Anaerocolumna cellulosilytica]MBB5196287.1 surfactin synthase thioesterase subunit [Anaerocolumna cellulosilytica]BCJ96317.1 thioesterase [Anaerocolumna cellulosilytica]